MIYSFFFAKSGGSRTPLLQLLVLKKAYIDDAYKDVPSINYTYWLAVVHALDDETMKII
jgi:hypothetical protein